ncbi:efflux RND transporter permease subunit [Shigella flexneri]
MMQKERENADRGNHRSGADAFTPNLMTSEASTLGVLPLVISHGAGSGAQNAVGTWCDGGRLPQQCWQFTSFRSFCCSGTSPCPL